MSRLLAPFVIWKVAAFGLLVGRSKWLSGRKNKSHKGGGGGKRAANCRGEEEHCSLSEAPRPVAWRQRAQQMVHNLISQPGTSLPSLGSRKGLGLGGWCSRQKTGFAKPAVHKGCRVRPNHCQIHALVGKEGVWVSVPHRARQESQALSGCESCTTGGFGAETRPPDKLLLELVSADSAGECSGL